MFRPIALYIGLRYTGAKHRNHFISFISLASMLGIALGVAVLITVLSVMNGFDDEIQQRVFGMANQLTINTVNGRLSAWQNLQQRLQQQPGIVAVTPFVATEAMISSSGLVQPGMLLGILPDQEKNVSILADKMVQGRLTDLQPGKFGIILGQTLADTLGVGVGDKVTLLTPQATLSPIGIIPNFKIFTVKGIFQVGNGFGFDSDLAFVHMQDGQALLHLGTDISGLRVKLQDLYQAPRFTEMLTRQLPPFYEVSDWTQQYGAFFHAIQLEKTMMFIILLLIVAVAAFNLVSTLVMVVNDKRADIAILRTLGATPLTILNIFIIQGGIIGLIGTLLGLLGGIALATHVTKIVQWIEQAFHVQLLSSSVYYVNYLPSKLQWSDVWQICVATLVLSLVATLYPAWRAARTEPAEALRYE